MNNKKYHVQNCLDTGICIAGVGVLRGNFEKGVRASILKPAPIIKKHPIHMLDFTEVGLYTLS